MTGQARGTSVAVAFLDPENDLNRVTDNRQTAHTAALGGPARGRERQIRCR